MSTSLVALDLAQHRRVRRHGLELWEVRQQKPSAIVYINPHEVHTRDRIANFCRDFAFDVFPEAVHVWLHV